MTPCLAPISAPRADVVQRTNEPRAISRGGVTDAVARLITRRSGHWMRWEEIAREAGDFRTELGSQSFEDLAVLIDAGYSRTAQGLNDSLLRAETAPGTALDQVAAFLVAALEIRRERGVFLSFRRGEDLPASMQRRLHEHDAAVRTRLKRLLGKGHRDGSLALRNLDSAVELLLASLQSAAVVVDGAEQRTWDSELVELLLAALAEPHPPEAEPVRNAVVVEGSCLCGDVRFEFDGPFEILSHCHCILCRRQHGAASAAFVSVPLTGFRWVAGQNKIFTYESSEHGRRTFCGTCGSPAPIVEAETGAVYCPRFAGLPPLA